MGVIYIACIGRTDNGRRRLISFWANLVPNHVLGTFHFMRSIEFNLIDALRKFLMVENIVVLVYMRVKIENQSLFHETIVFAV